MIDLDQLTYVVLGSADLDASVRFAREIVGLELVVREPDRAYLRGDDRNFNICYVTGDPRRHVIGFEVANAAALDSAAAGLDDAGFMPRRGTDAECDIRRVAGLIAFSDPTGNGIELVVDPAPGLTPYVPTREAGITEFSHIGLRTTDAPRDETFWTETLSARVSDWIGEVPLMRIDRVHHTVALFPSDRPGVQHVNFQVDSIDRVMQNYYFLKSCDVAIVFGPGRHPTSSATFVYFQGPDGVVYEYSTGVRLIDDEDSYQPRRFPFEPASFCMWGSRPDIPEFQT